MTKSIGVAEDAVRPRILTAAQAAAYLQISKSHLDKMRVAGTGPAHLYIGRVVRYRERALDAWIREREVRALSADGAAS